MNPTLRFGSSGPFVQQLQEGLNKLPSSLPALAPDGRYGGKTLARVKEFQSGHALSADGIVGPKTWDKMLALLAQWIPGGAPAAPEAPATPEPAVSGYEAKLPAALKWASDQIGKVDFGMFDKDGRPLGVDLVKTFFKEVVRQYGQPVMLADVNFKPDGWHGSKVWAPEPWVGHPKYGRKSWCGIFATWCYHKAGIPVFWDLAKGHPVGPADRPLKQASPQSPDFVSGIRPGFMGYVSSFHHQFLIEAVNDDGPAPTLRTIDGNGPKGQIRRRDGDHRVGKDNFLYRRFSA